MEIFGVGPFELLMIALIAFIILGPERIPGAMRWLGRAVRQVRQMSQQLTKDYGPEIKDITGEIAAVQAELRNIQRDLTDVTRGLMTGTEIIHPPRAANPAPIEPATPTVPPDAPPALSTSSIDTSATDSSATTESADASDIIDDRAGTPAP
jgi:sec-independent protein translocase protein TatB